MADNEVQGKEKAAKKKGAWKKNVERTNRWMREMRSELKKVIWPTPKQVLNNTIVVIVMVVVVGMFIGAFDWLTGSGVRALIQSVK